MTGIYNLSTHTVKEKGSMRRPKLYYGEGDINGEYENDMEEYHQHLDSLPEYPLPEEWRGKIADGAEIEYRLKYQVNILHSSAKEKAWKDVAETIYNHSLTERRIIAIPVLTPKEQPKETSEVENFLTEIIRHNGSKTDISQAASLLKRYYKQYGKVDQPKEDNESELWIEVLFDVKNHIEKFSGKEHEKLISHLQSKFKLSKL